MNGVHHAIYIFRCSGNYTVIGGVGGGGGGGNAYDKIIIKKKTLFSCNVVGHSGQIKLTSSI